MPQAASARRSSGVEFFIVSVNAPLTECDPPRRSEISFDARTRGHALVERDESGHLSLKALHALWKGVAQPLDDLKDRKIDVAQTPADEKSPAVFLQDALEIAEEFRHAIAPEILGAMP